jgi:hypothetical protein
MMLAKIGMNGTGFHPAASSRLYKAFIRPTMEYGIQIRPLPATQLSLLQKTQNLALRTIFSARRTTSIAAMHKLLLIEPMRERNNALNIKMAGRLLNSTDGSIPAVQIMWNRLSSRIPGSFTTDAQRNPLWENANLINHVLFRCNRTPMDPIATYTRLELKRIALDSIVAMDDQTDTVAGAINLLPNRILHRHAMLANNGMDRKQRIAIQRWLIGGVATHTPCINCGDGTEISRRHGIACSGASEMIRNEFPDQFTTPSRLNDIDRLLDFFKEEPPTDDFYYIIYSAIAMIYTNCLGYRQAANYYWQPPDNG